MGSLDERAPGKWRWRMRLGRDRVTGEPRTITRTFEAKSRAEAIKKVKAFLVEADRERDGSEMTMAELFDEWLRRLEVDGRSPHTIDTSKRTVARVLDPAIGTIKVKDLSVRDLEGLYVKLMTGDGAVSASTVRRYRAMVSSAMTMAVRWKIRSDNPARDALPPEVPKRKFTTPDPSEVMRITLALGEKNPVHGAVAVLAAQTGARRGELCALRWSDWHDEALSITASVWRVNGETGIKGTKSGHERVVWLMDDARAGLAGWRARCEHVAAGAGVELMPDSFIFSDWPDGSRPLNPDTLSASFRRTAVSLGLGHVHLHSLRHHAGTEMMARGVSVSDAAQVLGHSSPRTTMEFYGHPTLDRQKAAMATLQAALREGDPVNDKAPQPEG